MRQPYNKTLKKQFAQMVESLTPSFERFNGKSKYIFPSNYPYVHKVDEKRWLFLELFIDPKGRESFTISFGWSLKGRFPEVQEAHAFDLKPKSERFREEEFFQRAGVFLGGDKWWYVEDEKKKHEFFRKHFSFPPVSEEEAEEAVKTILTEVRKLLEDQVLPYLEEFLRSNK